MAWPAASSKVSEASLQRTIAGGMTAHVHRSRFHFFDLAPEQRFRSDDRGCAAILVIEGRADVDPVDDESTGRRRLNPDV